MEEDERLDQTTSSNADAVLYQLVEDVRAGSEHLEALRGLTVNIARVVTQRHQSSTKP